MKFISIFIAASLTAHAGPTDPGKAAIEFLEKVRLRKLDLDPGRDTALSARVIDDKKRKIARRLDRLAQELGSAPLELGTIKMDDNFAGVIVRKVSGYDPNSFRVFPVALVKRGDSWTPAPVPASFENVDTGYASTLRERLKSLENWMLREQISDLEKLRAESSEKVLRKIRAKLSVETLRQLDLNQVSSQFLAACEQRDAGLLLGLLGGLSVPLPDDWSRRLKAVDQALNRESSALRPWRSLIAPEVVRVIVQQQEEPDEALVSIACLDPHGLEKSPGAPRFEILNLNLTRNADRLWQINLPEAFLNRSADEEEEEGNDEETESNPDLLDAFPKKWNAIHPPTPQPSADAAQKALFSALQSPTMTTLFTLAQIDGEPQPARNAFVEAAKFWSLTHSPTASRHPMPLALHADGKSAVGLFQFFSTREPDKLDAKPVYYEQGSNGWRWTPVPSTSTLMKFEDWVAGESRGWAKRWQEKLLTDSLLLDPEFSKPAPDAAEARKAVEAWLAAIQRGDVTAALSHTARLNDARSASITIQNLGYEIAGSQKQAHPPTITGVYPGAIWTAVGVTSTQSGKTIHPLYPVIQTAGGPRILIEIDLFASGNRGRDFLNKAALERLKKITSPTIVDDLRVLYSKHQTQVETLAK